jgi:hypothetical protein
LADFWFEQARHLSFSLSRKIDVDRDRMMEQTVEDGAGDRLVAKHLAPGSEALILMMIEPAHNSAPPSDFGSGLLYGVSGKLGAPASSTACVGRASMPGK